MAGRRVSWEPSLLTNSSILGSLSSHVARKALNASSGEEEDTYAYMSLSSHAVRKALNASSGEEEDTYVHISLS